MTQAQVVLALDCSARTQTSEDQGFYRLVFHPQFGQSGSPNANYAYVCYSHKPALAGTGPNFSYWRVSRFTWLPASGTFDPDSETVLINQFDPDRWHNGGAMFFDNSGFLNITCGDGGDSIGLSQALANTQKINGGFFSGVFRIDVDNDPAKSHPIRRQPTNHAYKPAAWPLSSTQGYGVPNDNPWQDPAGSVLEEYSALGLRSPHTAHYDAATGDIWIGDVGEYSREEITVLPKGGNAQWGYKEGTIAGPGTKPSTITGTEALPFYDYDHTVGYCVIGGMRYRGAKWNAALGGKVLFGDHLRGKIWTATPGVNGAAPVIEEIVGSFHTGNKAGLANFCTDSAGEVYLMDVNGTNLDGGVIRKLVPAGIAAEPPALLSQTGVFTNLATLATAPGFVPFDVNTPLWSDGAQKQRWIMVPNNGTHDTAAEKINFSEKGNWLFPAGTVLVKHFEIPMDERNPSGVRRLETRFIVCTTNGGKYGLTYRWNAAGTDAQLLTTADSLDYDITLLDGTTVRRRWDFPSRADCVFCHNSTAGQALGLRTHQINRNFTYPSTGRTANQLTTFNALGMFDRTLTADEVKNFLQSRAIDDRTAPLEHRVRSYLDANSSHCHQPGGPVDYFDARLQTPFNTQGLMDATVQGHFTELGPGGRYLKPGDPALSALHLRLSHAGDGTAMPPLAKNVVDEEAVALLEDYLASTTLSEFQTEVPLQARYVRLTATSETNGSPWTSVAELSILDDKGVAIPASQLSVAAVDNEETINGNFPASLAIDGDPSTFWQTGYGAAGPAALPHFLTVDLGGVRPVGGFMHLPRQDGSQLGRIKDYQIHTSSDGIGWTLMTSGTMANSPSLLRYDALANVRPARCEIAGPVGDISSAFELTFAFDMDVADFSASDLQIAGGRLTDLRGKGSYYVATIVPTGSPLTATVPGNAVNPKGRGCRAATWQSTPQDIWPPVPRLLSVPTSVGGPFEILLTFDEPVSGLEISDFLITNGTLDTIVSEGDGWRLAVTPSGAGTVAVELRPGAVSDMASNPGADGLAVQIPYVPYVLDREAEAGAFSGGFVKADDATASGGSYIWVPQDTRGGSVTLDPAMKAAYAFSLPVAGEYYLRGWVKSENSTSDSFYVSVDGNTPVTWDTNRLGGSPGTTQFVQEAASVNGSAIVFNLATGVHTVELYGRDDGTRIDRLQFSPRHPHPVWSGPAVTYTNTFSVNLNILCYSGGASTPSKSSITVNGGQVLSVTPNGSNNFVVSVMATSPMVTLSLPAAAISIPIGGAGFNTPSTPFTVAYRAPFEQWAFVKHTDASSSGRLNDEDRDGIPKLLEYGFNLDPSKADFGMLDPVKSPASGLPRGFLKPEADGQRLWIQYVRRKGQSGLTYTPQFGPSPDNFTAPGGSPVVESLGTEWERVSVPDSAAVPSGARFGRVKVTLSP